MTPRRLEHVVKLGATCHQAVEIYVDDASKANRFEFAAAIEHDTLRQHKHIQPLEWRLVALDRSRIGDIDARIMQTGEVGAFRWRIVVRVRSCAPNVHHRSSMSKRMRYSVSDAARPADDQHLSTSEIQLIHLNSQTLDDSFRFDSV